MNIQTELTRLTNAKAAVKAAIEGKGVTVPDGTLLDGMAPLIESIEAGGVGVQSDWNQNDSTQPDYVKNRPFYTGNPVETVLVEESTVSFADEGGVYAGEVTSTFSATVGNTYMVYWDGAAYECTCIDFSGMTIIGNLSIAGAGSDTGEPFVMSVDNGQGILIETADTSASHTFSISGLVPEVVKIDPKYLPNTIATKSEVKAAQTTASNAQTTANNAKSEALDLAARMFGHTSVVDNAFYNDKTLSITSLPACIESIGVRAFAGCKNLALASLPSGLTSIGDEAFFQCTKLALTSLPSGLTSIGDEAFFQCINLALTSLPSGLTSIGNGAFSGCIELAFTSLPSGITSIGMRAFSGCFKLAFTSLPSGITSIGMNAFQGCTGLTSITFTGTPTSIGSNAFSGCTNLTTINVPWAEGEVANAPWGATNATINYNYTGA